MGTIANQKDGSNIQIEFQGIGTSQTSIMLQQPLLGESSESYTVEVTNFQMSLGEERATSKTTHPMMIIVDYSAAGYDLDVNVLGNEVDWTIYKDAVDSGASILDAWYSATRNIANSPNAGITIIEGIRSYSATDFILQLSQKISLATNDKLQFGVTPGGQFHLFSRLEYNPDFEFWTKRYVILDKSFQALTGWNDIIYGDANSLRTVALDANTDNDDLDDKYTPMLGKQIESFLSSSADLAWEVLDRRKRIRIDLTVPVGLTMGWKSTKEQKTYILQEYDIPKGRPTCSFLSSRSTNFQPTTSIQEKQLVSTTKFVDGGGKLALQKLFAGPVQALRLSLVLIYDYFDIQKKVWVERAKPLDMGSGDFFYLKLLFSKEST